MHLKLATISHYLTHRQVQWVLQITYPMTLWTVKIALCVFYLRLFPHPHFRKFVWGLMIFMTVIIIACTLSIFFQCTPLKRIWYGAKGGYCTNVIAQLLANAIIGLITDVIILVLPLQPLWGTNAQNSNQWWK